MISPNWKGEYLSYAVKSGGSLIVSGVGKSGNVANKIASTFSSLGLSSYFLHPVEALHGDLGRVTKSDAIIWISNSGTTEEITKLLPYIDIPKEMMVALVGNVASPIAKSCSIVLDAGVDKEACINNLAPTTSTTVAMALGDALAVLYESIVGLSKEKYAQNHPGGLLGKSLRLKVENLMIEKDQCGCIDQKSSLKDAVLAMTKFLSLIHI